LKSATQNKATRPATLKCLQEDVGIQASKIDELEMIKVEILKEIHVDKADAIAGILKNVNFAHKNASKSIKSFREKVEVILDPELEVTSSKVMKQEIKLSKPAMCDSGCNPSEFFELRPRE
jgi:hypothetical protein